jgi:signal transduction histidine kinase
MLFHIIQADARRLKQILVNLLSYTLKYTNTRKISLDISESPSFSKDSFTINFSLKDRMLSQRRGKKKKYLGLLQDDNSASHRYGSAGLGLSISNQL